MERSVQRKKAGRDMQRGWVLMTTIKSVCVRVCEVAGTQAERERAREGAKSEHKQNDCELNTSTSLSRNFVWGRGEKGVLMKGRLFFFAMATGWLVCLVGGEQKLFWLQGRVENRRVSWDGTSNGSKETQTTTVITPQQQDDYTTQKNNNNNELGRKRHNRAVMLCYVCVCVCGCCDGRDRQKRPAATTQNPERRRGAELG